MIIGHHSIRERLERAIRAERAAHSFLFLGSEHVGKFSIACEYAIRFLGGDTLVDLSRPTPDLVILSPERVEEKGKIREKSVGIEAVREAIHTVALSSYGGRGKVLIVENVGKLSEEAQNALLKTVEEPPEKTMILLVAHELGAALPTLLSRTEKVFFSPVPVEEMRSAFPGADETLLLLGCPGLIAPSEQDSISEDRLLLRTLVRFEQMPVFERLSIAEALANDIPRAERVLMLWIALLRERAASSSEIAKTIQFLLLAGAIHRTLRDIRRSVGSARILLEALFASGERSPIWAHSIFTSRV